MFEYTLHVLNCLRHALFCRIFGCARRVCAEARSQISCACARPHFMVDEFVPKPGRRIRVHVLSRFFEVDEFVPKPGRRYPAAPWKDFVCQAVVFCLVEQTSAFQSSR